MTDELASAREFASDPAGGVGASGDATSAGLTEADRAVRGLADPDGAAAARGFVERAVAPNTRRSYMNDLHQVRRWLAGFEHGEPIGKTEVRKLERLNEQQFDPIHLSTAEVVRFLTYKAGVLTEAGEPFYSPASLTRYVAAINWLFHNQGLPSPAEDPVVRALVVGIRKDNHRPVRRAAPLTLEPLVNTLLAIDIAHPTAGVLGVRDVALILFGFVGAFRGSELAALTLGDITTWSGEGLRVRVQSSKTDQLGVGGIKALPFGSNPVTCAPCAFARMYRLLEAQGTGRTKNRPAMMRTLRENTFAVHICQDVFPRTLPGAAPFLRGISSAGFLRDVPVSGDTVGRVVKRRAATAGVGISDISGHSLRAGFITEALNAGATPMEVMRQSLHKSESTILIYDRENNPLKRNAVTQVRL